MSFLSSSNPNLLVLAIEENTTHMQVDREQFQDTRIVSARSYAEAAGLLAAHKHGILRSAITSHVPTLDVMYL